jgi:hypothetical protein
MSQSHHKLFNLSKKDYAAVTKYTHPFASRLSRELNERITSGSESRPASQWEFEVRVAANIRALCAKIQSSAAKRYEENPDAANKRLLKLTTDACHVNDMTEAMRIASGIH